MKVKAYAKVNLALDVKGKLENGYHELEMCMVSVDFYDLIIINKAEETSFHCNKKYIVLDDKNTVVKAYKLLKEQYQFKENFKIEIIKNIPTQAGLAGGSTDAAAVIKALNNVLNLKLNDEEIIDLCLKIGADVPFTYYQKPAIVKGIGEKLEFFNFNCDFEILLIKPRKGISTKKCFETLNLAKCSHPNISLVKQALETNDYKMLVENMENSLEESSFRLNKEILKIKKELEKFNFDKVLMSGSGSCVFAITKDIKLLYESEKYFKKHKYFTRRCRVIK